MATALVTGGTSGIGAAFAQALARRGNDLVLVARDGDRLARVAADLESTYGVSVETISADLENRDDVDRVVARLEDDGRPIDTFINNAGFGVHARLLSQDVSAHDAGIEVMIRSVLVLGGAAARGMRSRGHGAILNVASVAGLITMGSYSAIKAWVASYSEGLAVELKGSGVRVTALLPGWVITEFHQRAGIRTSSIPSWMWIEAERLVDVALRDLDRGTVLSVPTLRYKFLVGLLRKLPRRTVRWVSGKISSNRHQGSQTETSSASKAL